MEGNAIEKSVLSIHKGRPFLMMPCLNLITNECCEGRLLYQWIRCCGCDANTTLLSVEVFAVFVLVLLVLLLKPRITTRVVILGFITQRMIKK